MKLLKFISILLFSLLLFGCSDNKITNEEEEDVREELIISSMMNIKETQEPTTRAGGEEKAFAEDTPLKLLVRDNRATSNPFTQEVRNVTTGAVSGTKNSLVLVPKLYWDDLGGKSADLKLMGIYPQSATLTGDLIPWNIPPQKELMTALVDNYIYSNRATPAHLPFKHALTKVTVSLIANEYYDLTALDAATVKFNVASKGNFDVLEQKFKNPEGDDPVTPAKTDYVDSGNSHIGYSFTILAMPFTAGSKLATVTINGNNYNINVTSKALEAGVHTHYSINIKKSDISATASLKDWETPVNEPIIARIVGIEDFTIGESGKIVITEGSEVTMLITDSNSDEGKKVHKAIYKYQKISEGKYQWISVQPVYWDNITAPVTHVKALLKIAGNDLSNGNKNGDLYLTGERSGSYPTQESIKLDDELGGIKFFKYPLSKISIVIKTTENDEKDKVNIAGISNVFIPGCGTFKVATDGITIERQDNSALNNQTITPGAYNGAKNQYACLPAFIYPQQLNSGILCTVTIREDDVNDNNKYNVKIDPATDFVSGTHYTYVVTIKKSDISITAGISDWADGGSTGIGSGLD